MRVDLVLTIIGPDRPGLVELVSKTVTANQGNWEGSRMARLAGRFAGILQVSVPEERADALAAALGALDAHGLSVVVERALVEGRQDPAVAASHLLRVEMVGNDRPGVIRDVSSAMVERAINVEELATECTSAPMSGGFLLKISAQVRAPREVGADGLRQLLEGRAPDFLIDVAVLEDPATTG